MSVRQSYTGQVVSARYNQFLTDKYGDSDRGILGYTLHILIVKAGTTKRWCLEMQVYADYVIKDRDNGKITYLHLISPIYHKVTEHLRAPVWSGDLSVGEPTERVGISAKGDLTPKYKNNKPYVMGDLVTPFCNLKQPLITGTWFIEEEPEPPVAIACSPIAPLSKEVLEDFFKAQTEFEQTNAQQVA